MKTFFIMLFIVHIHLFKSFYRVTSKLHHFVNIVLCKTQRLEAMTSGEVGREEIATKRANKTL